MFQNKDKDILGIYKYGCDPFCVSLLTDRRLKVRSNTDFVMISRQRRVYVCAWLVASRVARKKLGHDILRYVSNFRRSEGDKYFFIGKKPSRKHFEKNNRTEVLCIPSLTQPEFELMTSRSWQYILCHWDPCSNHSAISNLPCFIPFVLILISSNEIELAQHIIFCFHLHFHEYTCLIRAVWVIDSMRRLMMVNKHL